jgi:rhamnose transport system permease protein
MSRRPWLRWEMLLAAAVAAAFVANALLSPYFLNATTLSDASFNFTEKALVALPMALLIIAKEIDISVAAIMALASVAMGYGAIAGWPTPALVLLGIGVGVACGACNGLLVTALRVPSIVATIGTMSLFRGIAYGVLGDRVMKHYPPGFDYFGQGYLIGPVSFELLLFLAAALITGIILHATSAGRRIYAIGANASAARMSGVAVDRYRLALFIATGAASGLASVLLTSRLGSTRPSLAVGWELEIISMVILGGVAVAGGRGTILGVVLAAVLLGLVTFGLSLQNIPGIVLSIVVGTLLIAIVALPAVGARLATARAVRPARQG